MSAVAHLGTGTSTRHRKPLRVILAAPGEIGRMVDTSTSVLP
ncbi:MAG: hypothetical protein AVDCRST_MAG01-01-4992 [uncultured Rubrobacteraceae bacterium]|uniref:Uncharacterized protein n=1 Tax=uncultured Rubrobacteraceae bacterium TaxID=349277 RepID=A0A6J4QTN6_9ACTN|nr:MAG: hypothetical protein AVDCRST_MAG01-01-4992 [uncultured Rubrobacteraceae bacterium]